MEPQHDHNDGAAQIAQRQAGPRHSAPPAPGLMSMSVIGRDHARTAEEPPSLAQSLLSASRRVLESLLAGQLCRIPHRLPTAAKLFRNDPLIPLMTLTMTQLTPPAWYNVRLAKSIGEFPGSVKWPYCGAKPLGMGWVSR
jgi:hypothetical protein